ncbi:hypothetical protein HGM15179_010908 [Zosterops borbonicus]|uniref:Uncharacterized protein n=1 Tax=Zosterops borbonicus TaxID=364589 RepID=A0A8K1GCN7_9PASS|nr:hypothetical protein HGM15179_010908 [Zosterops borbonicus]
MEFQDTGNGFKLGKERFGWDFWKEFLAGMEFPGEAVAAPESLGVPKLEKGSSRETLELLPEPKGAPGELRRDLGQGMEFQDTGNGFKLGKGRFGWDFGKEFLAVRVLREWDGIPRAAVAAPESLEVQGQVGKKKLQGATSRA